ncbi:MAG: S-layer homology domain-containing protein [Patescibacteria group bacterium]|nr:S-layer homology domain-containing protein [Patescibacteria group bacterium]
MIAISILLTPSVQADYESDLRVICNREANTRARLGLGDDSSTIDFNNRCSEEAIRKAVAEYNASNQFYVPTIPIYTPTIFTTCNPYGPNAWYDSSINKCKCNNGYFFGKNNQGQDYCITLDEHCQGLYGFFSKGGDNIGECKCKEGYGFGKGSARREECISMNLWCQDELGSNAEYNESTQKCECGYGYGFVLMNNENGLGCVSCTIAYGIYSQYNPITKECGCLAGYQLTQGDLYGTICTKATPEFICYDIVNGYLGSDGQCYCNQGYIWSDDQKLCIKKIANSPRAINAPQKLTVGNSIDDGEKSNSSRSSFSDISEAYRFHEAVNNLRDKGAIKGYSDGTFKPRSFVTRAEFLKIALEGQEPPENYNTACFADIEPNQWFTRFVCRAKEAGWVNGYPDGTFGPNANITQAEAMKIAFKVHSLQTEGDTTGANWYQPFVNKVKEKGYLPEDVINYNKLMTRGEIAEMVWNIIK